MTSTCLSPPLYLSASNCTQCPPNPTIPPLLHHISPLHPSYTLSKPSQCDMVLYTDNFIHPFTNGAVSADVCGRVAEYKRRGDRGGVGRSHPALIKISVPHHRDKVNHPIVASDPTHKSFLLLLRFPRYLGLCTLHPVSQAPS